jgi:hypothetical protein
MVVVACIRVTLQIASLPASGAPAAARCNLNDFVSLFYYSALEKTDFPTITPGIVRQARKNYPDSKIYNLASVITKNDDASGRELAGKIGGALGNKRVQQRNICRSKVEGERLLRRAPAQLAMIVGGWEGR